MIKKTFLFPEYYISKQAYCDECKVPLIDTNRRLLTYPNTKAVMYCPKCNKEYHIGSNELEGEWKWKTI